MKLITTSEPFFSGIELQDTLRKHNFIQDWFVYTQDGYNYGIIYEAN